MRPHKLITPTKQENRHKWWERYKEIPSYHFTYQNSGRNHRLPSPFHQKGVDEETELVCISPGWYVVGYTLSAPFYPNDYKSIAIMFSTNDGEKMWFHFVQ